MWSANVGETSIGSVGPTSPNLHEMCALPRFRDETSLDMSFKVDMVCWNLKRWPWSFGSDRQSLHIQCPQIVSSVALVAAFFLWAGFLWHSSYRPTPSTWRIINDLPRYANRDIQVFKTVWNIEMMGDEETAAITNGKRAKNSVVLTPSGSPWQHHTESLRIAAWDNDPCIKQNQTFSVSDWFQGRLSNWFSQIQLFILNRVQQRTFGQVDSPCPLIYHSQLKQWGAVKSCSSQ